MGKRTTSHTLRTVAVVAAVVLCTAATASTLRWANRGDMQTTDPHSQNEGLTNNLNSLVYEFLVDRDKELNLRPSLAESWQRVDDTTWRLKLRAGVKFPVTLPAKWDCLPVARLLPYPVRAGVRGVNVPGFQTCHAWQFLEEP